MTIEGIPASQPQEPIKEQQPVKESPVGSEVFSVRLAASAVPAFKHLVQLHFKLGHIPQATESAYLQYLVVKDAEQMRDDIKKRRAAIAR
jgi:hypothetical protein